MSSITECGLRVEASFSPLIPFEVASKDKASFCLVPRHRDGETGVWQADLLIQIGVVI